MRKFIFTILLCITCNISNATPQLHDKIILDGEVWEIPVSLLTKLDADTYEAVMEILGERVAVSSANHRGYVAPGASGWDGGYKPVPVYRFLLEHIGMI